MLDQPDRLFEAAKTGDMPALNALLQHGALELDVRRASDGNTALHIAILNGKNEFAECLIEKGADKEARNNLGNRPLHCAVLAGDQEMVVFLLGLGVNYKAPNYLNEKLIITHVEQNQVARSGQCFQRDWLNRRSNDDFEIFTSSATTHLSVQSTSEAVVKKVNDQLFETYGRGDDLYYQPRCHEHLREKIAAMNHLSQIGSSEEIHITFGLTPLQLAQKLETWDIADCISTFRHKQKQSSQGGVSLQGLKEPNVDLAKQREQLQGLQKWESLNFVSTGYATAFAVTGIAGGMLADSSFYKFIFIMLFAVGLKVLMDRGSANVSECYKNFARDAHEFFNKHVPHALRKHGFTLAKVDVPPGAVIVTATGIAQVHAPSNVNVDAPVNPCCIM